MAEGSGLRIKPLKRGMYFLLLLGSMFVFVGAGLAADALIRGTVEGQPGAVMIVPIILWWPYAIYISVRRLRDMRMSAWWLAALLVPFLNLYPSLKLLFGGSVEDTEVVR